MGANTVLALRKFESYTASGFTQFYDENTPLWRPSAHR